MSIEFSKLQEDAIMTYGKNVLVSAAAGSGKTGVLTERVARLIAGDAPIKEKVSLDDILVMTFTKNAASEMKNRIKEALTNIIDEKIDKNEDVENIEYELSLIPNANIQTIDSFCKEIIDTNFQLIEKLDPKYRIADEKELIMLKNDVENEVLDEKYGDEKYKNFLKSYFNKDDKTIKSMLDKGLSYIYGKAFPLEYIEELRLKWQDINIKAKEEYISSTLKNTRAAIKNELDNIEKALEDTQKLLDIASDKEEDRLFYDNLLSINDHIEKFYELFIKSNDENFIKNVSNYKNIISPIEIIRKKNEHKVLDKTSINLGKSFARGSDEDIILKKMLKAYIHFFLTKKAFLNEYANILYNIDKISEEQINNQDELTYLDILEELYKRYEEEKCNKNMIAISDIQKIVLELLYDKKGQSYEYSDLSKILSEKYKYIFIDEYQDTSIIQEKIIEALTLGYTKKNLFLVGDVKQSIYKFRNADVSIFNEKYEKYKKDSNDKNADNILIELNENYRSSNETIDFINGVFDEVMTKEFSLIDYKNDGELKHARNEEKINEYLKNINKKANLYILDAKNMKEEADVVADIIEKLHFIDKTPYKDITILLRQEKRTFATFLDSLQAKDIPAICEMSSGFYDTYEIQLLIDLLSIVDNPYDDVKLCSLLTSVIYDVQNNELAFLRKEYNSYIDINKTGYFSLEEAIQVYIKKCEENKYEDKKDIIDKYDINVDSLYFKLKNYADMLDRFRSLSRYKTISELLNVIYVETNITSLIYNMPNGRVRFNNLKLLLEKAKIYENTSFVGLNNFIRYLEKIKNNNVDEGGNKTSDIDDDIVRISTIHKSKGLQYKIVILPNLQAEYNANSYKENNKRNNLVAFDDEYGISLNYIDYKKKLEFVTPKRELINKKEEWASKREEARVFYVAMTRAEEKLILIDRVKGRKELGDLLSIKKYRDLIRYSLERHDNPEKIVDIIEKDRNYIEEVSKDIDYKKEVEDIKILDNDIEIKNESLYSQYSEEHLSKNLAFSSRYDELILENPKISVSSIKAYKYEKNEIDKNTNNNSNMDIDIDSYDKKDEMEYEIENYDFNQTIDRRSTDIGNLYHRFMELYDFNEDIEASLKKMVDEKLIDEDALKYLDINRLISFTGTRLYENMKKAYNNNSLFREKRFMHYFTKNQINKYEGKTEDSILNPKIIVQGIIDSFYVEIDENGEKVIDLIDYKTDGLKYGKILEETLIDRYQVQLDIYAKALEESTNMKVRNKIIYSFALNKEIVWKA